LAWPNHAVPTKTTPRLSRSPRRCYRSREEGGTG
jgi:hypothetical protein